MEGRRYSLVFNNCHPLLLFIIIGLFQVRTPPLCPSALLVPVGITSTGTSTSTTSFLRPARSAAADLIRSLIGDRALWEGARALLLSFLLERPLLWICWIVGSAQGPPSSRCGNGDDVLIPGSGDRRSTSVSPALSLCGTGEWRVGCVGTRGRMDGVSALPADDHTPHTLWVRGSED